MYKIKKRTIYELITQHLLIHIREEETLKLKYSFKINYAKLIAILAIFFVATFIANYFIFNVISNYYIGNENTEKKYKRTLIDLTQKLDSIKFEVAKKDSFITNIKKIIAGEKK